MRTILDCGRPDVKAVEFGDGDAVVTHRNGTVCRWKAAPGASVVVTDSLMQSFLTMPGA